MSQILVSNDARTFFVEVVQDDEGYVTSTCPVHGVLEGDRFRPDDNIQDALTHVDRFHEDGAEDGE